MGLNFVSGLVRLVLDDFEDLDGRPRLERAFEAIQRGFSQEDQKNILIGLAKLGSYFEEQQKEKICTLIDKYYHEEFEYFAEEFELYYLLHDKYKKLLLRIQELNKKIYEQVRTIQ